MNGRLVIQSINMLYLIDNNCENACVFEEIPQFFKIN